MNHLNLIFLALVCLSSFFAIGSAQTCGKQTFGKFDYDLTQLTKPTASPYTGQETTSGVTYTYYWNFCQNLGTPYDKLASPTVQIDGSNQVSVGFLTGYIITELAPGKGIQLTYSNDQNKCGGGSITRHSYIKVECAAGDTALVSITEDPSVKCQYTYNMKSIHACPTNGPGPTPDKKKDDGLSGGSIFLIIFFVGFALYFLAGAAFQWKVKGATGIEIIPNTEFWTGLPGLIADGGRFALSKVRGGGGYSSV